MSSELRRLSYFVLRLLLPSHIQSVGYWNHLRVEACHCVLAVHPRENTHNNWPTTAARGWICREDNGAGKWPKRRYVVEEKFGEKFVIFFIIVFWRKFITILDGGFDFFICLRNRCQQSSGLKRGTKTAKGVFFKKIFIRNHMKICSTLFRVDSEVNHESYSTYLRYHTSSAKTFPLCHAQQEVGRTI